MCPRISTFRRLIVAALATLAALVAYLRWLRPWYLRWGATAAEWSRPLPGDEVVPRPRQVATRAVTIQAPAGQVWPWLAQIGQGRGGLYSYEWLENLIGCAMHNADHIIPECQHVKVGDRIGLGPEGYPFYSVAAVEPGRALVLRGGDLAVDAPPVNDTWAFVLEPVSDRATRLIARNRRDFPPTPGNRLMWQVIVEPAHFIMERKMLLGLKQRAEAAWHS